jgi:predicted 2-oxoglutarate/Fe(II)-dependent dioxygenase YbiX
LLHKEPKPYTGGELVFTDYRFTPDLQNNSVILFPSFMTHAVEPVRGPGRHSLNQFFFVHIG